VVAHVIFLPGVIMPCELRYAALLRELGGDARAVTKDLELYAGPATPPPGYGVPTEVEAINQTADAAGLDQFHLYGHSGGGAIALAYVTAHPMRVLSLAVDEPAYDFLDSPETRSYWSEIEEVATLPERERMPAFLRLQLGPGVPLPPPPPGPPPPWMANRPAGVRALATALEQHRVDPGSYRQFAAPVYFSHGSLSHPYWLGMRDRLAGLFPDFTAERYEGLHHLNTSHQAEPARVAAALRRHWSRARKAPRY
jgi:pimeloyl-ACP methyl ester carboxylesterase